MASSSSSDLTTSEKKALTAVIRTGKMMLDQQKFWADLEKDFKNNYEKYLRETKEKPPKKKEDYVAEKRQNMINEIERLNEKLASVDRRQALNEAYGVFFEGFLKAKGFPLAEFDVEEKEKKFITDLTVQKIQELARSINVRPSANLTDSEKTALTAVSGTGEVMLDRQQLLTKLEKKFKDKSKLQNVLRAIESLNEKLASVGRQALNTEYGIFYKKLKQSKNPDHQTIVPLLDVDEEKENFITDLTVQKIKELVRASPPPPPAPEQKKNDDEDDDLARAAQQLEAAAAAGAQPQRSTLPIDIQQAMEMIQSISKSSVGSVSEEQLKNWSKALQSFLFPSQS